MANTPTFLGTHTYSASDLLATISLDVKSLSTAAWTAIKQMIGDDAVFEGIAEGVHAMGLPAKTASLTQATTSAPLPNRTAAKTAADLKIA